MALPNLNEHFAKNPERARTIVSEAIKKRSKQKTENFERETKLLESAVEALKEKEALLKSRAKIDHKTLLLHSEFLTNEVSYYKAKFGAMKEEKAKAAEHQRDLKNRMKAILNREKK